MRNYVFTRFGGFMMVVLTTPHTRKFISSVTSAGFRSGQLGVPCKRLQGNYTFILHGSLRSFSLFICTKKHLCKGVQ